jgi:uncharacterized Zn finger protein
MSNVEFSVQGSAEVPYTVSFSSDGNGNLTARCTCPAGAVRQYCKHRFNILLGDVSDIVSPNTELVHVVYDWYRGSDVERAIKEIETLEAEMDALKKRLTAAKKMVAQAMND